MAIAISSPIAGSAPSQILVIPVRELAPWSCFFGLFAMSVLC